MTTNKVVFDAGINNTFTLSGLSFLDGILVTEKEAEIELVRNYIKQTGEPWQEVEYNPTNPRHNRLLLGHPNTVVSGVQTSADMGPASNQLAAAIIDGSFTNLAAENADAVNALNVALTNEASAAPEAKPEAKGAAGLHLKK